MRTGISYSFTKDGYYESAWYRAIESRKLEKNYHGFFQTNSISRSASLPQSHDAVAAWFVHTIVKWQPFTSAN